MTTFLNNHNYFIILYSFTSGVIAGSFLNVCISRIPKNESIILPGSRCPLCNIPIPFYDNIPIFSYLILKGKCRSCRQKISIRYPAVEILTGFTGSAFAVHSGASPDALIWFLFVCVLIMVSCIDIEYRIIPDIISIPGTIFFSLTNIFLLGANIFSVVGGIAAGSGTLLLVSLIYYLLRKRAGIGGGDIKLMAMIGGTIGIKGALFTIFAGSVSGSLAGIVLIMSSLINQKKINLMQQIPFGPFLSFGAFIYIFYGQQIIHWYLFKNFP